MKHKAIIFFSVILLIIPALGYGQEDPMVKSIKERFDLYGKTSLQEKIYLHTDRSLYLIGETMWFKAYYLDGSAYRFLDMSKVAYLEILDKENNAVAQTKFSLLSGKGNGSLLIPAAIASGNYKVRCYTNWMKNFNADYFFETNVSIINPFVKFDPEPDANKETAYDVQFFPEGGYLVKGIESKMAFRAVGQDAKGIDFRGLIVGPENDTIARFRPGKFGIGYFMFKPEKTSGYKAIIIDVKGKQSSFSLPEVQERGYVMRVTDSASDQLKVTVLSTLQQEDKVPVYIITHTRHANQIVEKHLLTNNQTEFFIKKEQLGEGISHITILNERLKPVCERLYFKRPAEQLNIGANTDKREYAGREKVTLDMTAGTGTNLSDLANMSVSVFLSDSIRTLPQNDIFSYIFLTSDLKGNVENPAYYFENNTKETDQDLDNLMISQGMEEIQMGRSF